MRLKKAACLILNIAIPLAVGGISAWLTNDHMQQFEQLKKPPLSPPAVVFPIVWTALYVLMGVSVYLFEQNAPDPHDQKKPLILYGVQLAMNFCWTLMFFNLEWRLFSFIWLLGLLATVIWMQRSFFRLNTLSAYLQTPYLLWLAFAGYLNLAIYLLNR